MELSHVQHPTCSAWVCVCSLYLVCVLLNEVEAYGSISFGSPVFSCSYLHSAGVPSAPRNVISIVNETSVILEWHPPRETGGRDDVVYNIVCKKCRADGQSHCSHCDDNVEFSPRQAGLTETRVLISNLLAHTLYTFQIQAVNGVSNKSPYPAQHVAIDITTNQAGKSRFAGMGGLFGKTYPKCCHAKGRCMIV